MKYAIVNGNKTEAIKGLKGYCPSCNMELIAKCGEQKINHWAHKGVRSCDLWWERETEWHRAWKKNFPIEWQEISLTDFKTGERHIADVRTKDNLVIEFQHSYLDSKERVSREKFYKNMVWIVDGSRLKRDYPRFLKGTENFHNTKIKDIFLVEFIEEIFPENWLSSSVTILFDYKGSSTNNDQSNVQNHLICLFPIRIGRSAVVAKISKKAFINASIDGDWSLRVQNFMESLIPPKKEKRIQNPAALQVKKDESTHYYDQKKGKFIKKRRF